MQRPCPAPVGASNGFIAEEKRICRFCSALCENGSRRSGKQWICAACVEVGFAEVTTPPDIVVSRGTMHISTSGMATVCCRSCGRISSYLSTEFPKLNGWSKKKGAWWKCCMASENPASVTNKNNGAPDVSTKLQLEKPLGVVKNKGALVLSLDKEAMLKSWLPLQMRLNKACVPRLREFMGCSDEAVFPLGTSASPTAFVLTSGAPETSECALQCVSQLQSAGFTPRLLVGLDMMGNAKAKDAVKDWYRGFNGAHLAWFLRFVVPIYEAMRNFRWEDSVVVVEDSFRFAPGITAKHVSGIASGKSAWLGYRRFKKQVTKYGGYVQAVDANDILTGENFSSRELPIGSKCFSFTKRGLLALWHIMLQTDSRKNYHDWHSRCLVVSGTMTLQRPAMGGSAAHFSYQDRKKQSEELPECMKPEDVPKYTHIQPKAQTLPANIYEPGSFGICQFSFDAEAYGEEFVSLCKSDLLVRNFDEPSGWSFGWTVDGCSKAARKGFFPTAYWAPN